MKHARLLFLFCSVCFAVSCASAPPPSPPPAQADLWPKIYSDETYLSAFASTWSEDESLGAIRNLQNSIVEFSADLPLTELNVDPYGFRARWSWTENTFVTKSAGCVIPFDQVSAMLLEYYPLLDKNYKWGLLVSLAGGNRVSLRTPSRDAAERLGKAILVLATARGSKVSLPNMRFGAALGPLSEAQARAAGILQPDGIIVSWIFKESPAEKAGLSPQDIITGAEGKPVGKTDDLFAAIDAAAASGARQFKITGLRRSYKKEGQTYIEIFVPLEFTLPIEQPEAPK